jgi:ElaB/YqjD/DUF883 family membrane-anchored ribosome-binding protein
MVNSPELQEALTKHQQAQTKRRELERELQEIDQKIQVAIVKADINEIQSLNQRKKELPDLLLQASCEEHVAMNAEHQARNSLLWNLEAQTTNEHEEAKQELAKLQRKHEQELKEAERLVEVTRHRMNGATNEIASRSTQYSRSTTRYHQVVAELN